MRAAIALKCFALVLVVTFAGSPRPLAAASLSSSDPTVAESVAGVELLALLAGWAAGSSKDGDRAMGTASIGVALLAPGTGPGTATLRVGLVALGAYNFQLHRDEATRTERQQGNFWGVNAVALAAWFATRGDASGGSRFSESGGGWAVQPWAAPDTLGVALRYRY